MYFLALLLTLRTREPCNFSCTLEDTEGSASLILAKQAEAPQRRSETHVALIWDDRSHAHLRLSCLNMTGGMLKKAVQQAVASGSGLRYAGQDCDVESVDLTNTRLAGTASWADMIGGLPGPRMKLTFATPLFTSPSGRQENNALPFPDPLTLFTAAQQQWQNLSGPALPYAGEQAVDLAKCMVAEYHLETVKRAFSHGDFTGYQGWIEYICLRRDEAAIASLNALARLAFFTGNGYFTERGMGVTIMSITN